MKKIESWDDVTWMQNEYKYIIGLTPKDARVLKTSLKYLPLHASNEPEIITLMNAIEDVATVDNTKQK